MSDYYRYVITIRYVSALIVFPDLPDPMFQSLSLKIDLCKNSFSNTPFISRSHSKVGVRVKFLLLLYECFLSLQFKLSASE